MICAKRQRLRASRFKDLGASLVFGLDLFESQRRIVEHSKLKIAARRKDMSLPIGSQGIGADTLE